MDPNETLRRIIERMAGRELTDTEATRVGQALGRSTVPEAIADVVYAVVGDGGE